MHCLYMERVEDSFLSLDTYNDTVEGPLSITKNKAAESPPAY